LARALRARSAPALEKRVIMAEAAEGPTPVGVRRRFARWSRELQTVRSPLLRYAFSVLAIAIALGLGLMFRRYQADDAALPLLSIAVAMVTWYAGGGPSVLAVLLAAVCFNYFFSDPLYTFEVSRSDLPYFLVFVVWAVMVASFSAIRRRSDENLRHARDHLQAEVVLRARREDEIKTLNLELARRAAELEATNRELESFAYSVSHDLRAPLRHVVGFSELLQKQVSSSLDDKSRRYLRTIVESARRMGDLIDDLLAFSRIGRTETRATTVDLQQIVREAIAEMAPETKDRDIAWKIGTLPVTYGDRAMLKLVVVNLVSNAVKFTRARAPAEIEIGCAGTNRNEIEVFVRDNGAGFDMRYVHKLFGVFQRLHLAEEFEGTGIGLATVQRIIHRHGGNVRAEGAVDKGATFTFSLPIAQGGAAMTANTP
jgi:signal transduction histidine kinase